MVGAGDTLQGIALAVFGDAKLWYLIADANGLQSDGDLKVGQTLSMPNQITNIHNSFDTFKPYNAGEIIGDTTPTLPDPPPPPSSSGGCGVGNIIVAIIAVVVTIYTAGAFSMVGSALSSGFGATMSAGLGAGLGASAAGAVVGSIVSQAVGIAIGVQDKFSWQAVAVAGLTAAIPIGNVGKSLGLKGGWQLAANAAARNIVSQGVSIAVGVQDKFNWRSLAAAAIAAPLTSKIDEAFDTKGLSANEFSADRFGQQLMSESLKSITRQGAAILVNGSGKMSWTQVASDGFGNAIGNSIVEHSLVRPAQQAAMARDLRTMQMKGAAARVHTRYVPGADQKALARQGAAAGVAYKAAPAVAKAAPTTSEALGAQKDLERAVAEGSGRLGGETVRPGDINLSSLDGFSFGREFYGAGSKAKPAEDLSNFGTYLKVMGDLALDTVSNIVSDGFAAFGKGFVTFAVDLEAGEKTGAELKNLLDLYNSDTQTAQHLKDQLANSSFTQDIGMGMMTIDEWAGLSDENKAYLEAALVALPLTRVGQFKGFVPNKYTHSAPYSGDVYDPNFVGPHLQKSDWVSPSFKPQSSTYEGRIYRYEVNDPNRLESTWQAHEWNVASNHRYTQPGNGGVYAGTTEATARAEISHYGALDGRVLVTQDIKQSNLLDLRKNRVRNQMNVNRGDLIDTSHNYQLTHDIGDWAKREGYSGLLVPSARDKGGANIILFDGL
ncbi:RES domain-containing protein [Amphritea sp. RP18W]|uniref:RES domain-containing protein n=1 Tax=Amphritea pacifica TaxID=2811233 RepID=A0ABS2WDQ9_9GAMM|nr:RES domain-containing protein [Amphritea pacifica]